MRWAFWRSRARRQQDPGRPTEADPARAAAPDGRAARQDDPDPDARRASAFSGAAPQPGAAPEHGASSGPGVDVDAAAHADVDLAGVREDVVDLVRAALSRNRAAVSAVLDRVGSRGPDAAGMAAVVALGALSDRLVVLAGFPPEAEPSDPALSAAVVAQGDTVAGRAGPLLRAVVPDAPRGLTRFAVRLSCGVTEADDAVAQHVDDEPDDLIRVAAVLLAQTVLDEAGDLDALAAELAQLLDG